MNENTLNNPLAVPEWKNGCMEQVLFLFETKEAFKYSFSNNLEDIQIAAFARTGVKINLDNARWILNPRLSIDVKHSMNLYNADYSMTTDKKNDTNYIIVNMRNGVKWFTTSFSEINGNYHCSELIRIYNKTLRFLMKGISSCDEEPDDE